MLASFLVVFFPLYFLSQRTVKSFDEFTRKALEEEMISQAFMLGEQYRDMYLDSSRNKEEKFAATLQRYSEQFQSRLQVLSPRGVVLFDSDIDSLIGADFSDRKEIKNVMDGGCYRAAWRLTGNGKYVFYFVPIAIKHDGELIGIAYVTHHTGQITKAIKKMIYQQRLTMAIALASALLTSAIIAFMLTRRLRKLTRASMDYAKGNAPLKLSVGGHDEIGELGAAVHYMAEEIEERHNYNRDFVSTVMHELKTPVTAIKGAVEVLQQGAVDKKEARDKFLSNIRYEVNRLTRMVGELSELTRLDVEMFRGKKEKVNYCQCVRDIMDRIMPTFDQEHAAFKLLLPEEDIQVMVVPGRIEQVISNLLENAFRYTPVSGVIELKVEKNDDGLVSTSVKDSGPGIPAASLEKVFERFYTTERKDVPKDYGSGLGLAVAKSIVENHQGRIWASSEEGNGACFMFTLSVVNH